MIYAHIIAWLCPCRDHLAGWLHQRNSSKYCVSHKLCGLAAYAAAYPFAQFIAGFCKTIYLAM